MEKKISIKNIYLLFVTCFGLIGLGLGSTYAVFVASASIDNPITLVSNLSYENKVMEIIEVEVDEYEIKNVTLNINNNTNSTTNYTTWYIEQTDIDMGVATSSGDPSGTLEEGNSTTVTVDIMNNTSESIKVTLGVSQGNTITLGKDMQTVPSESFTAYAVYSSDDNSLTFYNTLDTITKDEIYNGKTVTEVYTGVTTIVWNNESKIPWASYSGSITNVVVEDIIIPIGTQYWFSNFTNCTDMNLLKLDTSKVTDMSKMFYECNSLATLDVNNFDTSSVTNMTNMFIGCSSLTTLDVSSWDTSQVMSMYQMFASCGGLTTLDLSNFDTSNVTTMYGMFNGCSSLTSIDLSGWNTSQLTTMARMFESCNNLTTVDLSSFDTSNVTSTQRLFQYCGNLTTIYVSDKWTTESVTDTKNEFLGCGSLVGGAGTTFRGSDIIYARIDGGTDNPGYFTDIADKTE